MIKKTILAVLMVGFMFVEAQAKEITFLCEGNQESYNASGTTTQKFQISGMYIYDTVKKTINDHPNIYKCKETASHITCIEEDKTTTIIKINRYTLRLSEDHTRKHGSGFYRSYQCEIAPEKAF